MSDAPWIKFYPSDWLTGTRGMTAAETGVYITLIALMYEKGAPLQNTAALARTCGCTAPLFRRVLDALIEQEKITETEGLLFNDRVEKELDARVRSSSVRAAAASARWQKDETNQGNESKVALQNASTRTRGQIPDTRSQIPEADSSQLSLIQTENLDHGDNSLGSRSKKSSGKRGARLSPDWKLPLGWGRWAMSEFPHLTELDIRRLGDDFRDYWIAVPGTKGTKLDWEATWRNSVRMKAPKIRPQSSGAPLRGVAALSEQLRQEIIDGKYGQFGGVGGEEGGGSAIAGLLSDSSRQRH